MSKVVFLLKVFEREEYMNSFINGFLYLNTLSYFRKLEEENPVQRADEYEGLSEWLQPDDIKLVLNGHQFNNIAAPFQLRKLSNDYLNVFCMFAGTTEVENLNSQSEKEQVIKDLSISDRIKELGKFCVLINDVNQFISRVKRKAEQCGFNGEFGMVNYYDADIKSIISRGYKPALYKHDKYSYQSEYRFIIDNNEELNRPLILNIGSITDICQIINLDEFKVKII